MHILYIMASQVAWVKNMPANAEDSGDTDSISG